MMCPHNLPRWLCMEEDCTYAERKARPPLLAGMDSKPIHNKELESEIPDWPTNLRHPMFTLNGITYMLEYGEVFYSVLGSWNASDGELQYG